MTVLGGLMGSGGGSIVGGAVVRLFLDDAQFNRALTTAEAKTKGATGTMAGGFSRFGALAKAGLITAGVAVVGFVASAVREFMQAEQIMAQTEAVIRSTGGAAGFTAQEIKDMASEFQDLTTYEDDAVQSAENMLLTFTRIGHDVFPDTTAAVLDMSTALGTDLQSSAIRVGKALQDPTIGLTALRRVGVAFTAQQREQIAAFMEANDLMGAQKIILGELSTEFGGSAAAAADTYAGKIQQLSNEWKEVKENAGDFFLQVAFGHQVVLDAESSMDDWREAMQTLIDLGAVDEAKALAESYGQVDLAQRAAAISANVNTEALTNFANMTSDALESWQEEATGSMSFVEASFDDLSSAANVTAREILRSFEKALSAQADFEKNSNKFLGSVAKNLGPDMRVAASEMVASLAEKGPEGAALMAALADSSGKMRKRILADWIASGQGAQNYISDLAAVDAKLNALDGRQVNIDIITHHIQTGKLD